jgi:hypothetical protein
MVLCFLGMAAVMGAMGAAMGATGLALALAVILVTGKFKHISLK